jgi:ceramide glucosyltransferase
VQFLLLILAILAALSCLLTVWQWLAARNFPLHHKAAVDGFAPAISVLKPLKGCDNTTADSLQTWFRQVYPGPIEILFGVADPDDPVCEIVRRLLAAYPALPARLVICQQSLGANAKISQLAQLQKLASHDLILISDADVAVPADFLVNFVSPLGDSQTGLVNCFYRLANPATLAMQWEAIAINSDFWSQVLQSKTLKSLDFALGAAILVRRAALVEIGGFAALVDCLADDFQLGLRIARNGHRIALCPTVVECYDKPQNWRQVWKHQLRWARTIRVCQPGPYFFSLLSNATLWPMFWLGADLMVGSGWRIGLIVGSLLALRILLARDLQRRFTPGRSLVSPFWLVPVKDLLQAALWLAAFAGNKVEWRGRTMRVRRDGTLVAVSGVSQDI